MSSIAEILKRLTRKQIWLLVTGTPFLILSSNVSLFAFTGCTLLPNSDAEIAAQGVVWIVTGLFTLVVQVEMKE